jgi:hypothetical protein
VAGLVILIITIIIISAVVGAIAQFLNKLNELNAQPARRPPGARGEAARQADRDMDRFLAEIDRLRKKNADAAGQAEPQPRQQANGAATNRPTARPVSPPKSDRERDREQREREREQRQRERERERERPRPRPVAEQAEPTSRRIEASPPAFLAPPAPSKPSRVEELPVATVVAPSAGIGVPATRVTQLPQRARPAPKTDLAQNLGTLLGSGQGVAIAIILQEVLGPPKCRKPAGSA